MHSQAPPSALTLTMATRWTVFDLCDVVSWIVNSQTVGYFASWEDWDATQGALANLPIYVKTGALLAAGACNVLSDVKMMPS